MERTVSTQQVWIYIDESDRRHSQPLSNQIIDLLRRHGCPGATVLRGVAGYGAHNVLHTTLAVDVPSHLPLIITLVDRAERLAKVLPELSELVQEGLITVTPVEVIKSTARAGGPFPRNLTVADVMAREVVKVSPETPLPAVVALLIDRAVRSLPVVDAAGRVLGIITDGDLLRRGATSLSVALQRELPADERTIHADAQAHAPRCAADLMTPDPLVLPMSMPLAEAATEMVEHNLKRFPVVDAAGRLSGMLSRHDLLETVAEGLHERPSEPLQLPVGAPASVSGLMLTEVPTVHPDTPLAETIERLLETSKRRVVVVDAQRRVVGIITDGDVLRRAARLPGGALRRMASWLMGGERPKPRELEIETRGRSAAEVMTSPVITVGSSTSIAEAIRLMLAHNVKRLPVIDPDGTLVGLVGRAGLLVALSARSR